MIFTYLKKTILSKKVFQVIDNQLNHWHYADKNTFQERINSVWAYAYVWEFNSSFYSLGGFTSSSVIENNLHKTLLKIFKHDDYYKQLHYALEKYLTLARETKNYLFEFKDVYNISGYDKMHKELITYIDGRDAGRADAIQSITFKRPLNESLLLRDYLKSGKLRFKDYKDLFLHSNKEMINANFSQLELDDFDKKFTNTNKPQDENKNPDQDKILNNIRAFENENVFGSNNLDIAIRVINSATKSFCLDNKQVKSLTSNQGLSFISQWEMKAFLLHLFSRHSYYIHGAEFQDMIFNRMCSSEVFFGSYSDREEQFIAQREKIYSKMNTVTQLYDAGFFAILNKTFNINDLSKNQLGKLVGDFVTCIEACNIEKVISEIVE